MSLSHLAIAASLVPMLACSAVAGETRNQPNLIVVLVDDFGYECVGAYGGTSYKTPHLNALADTGTRYEHCYAQPVCTPSRVQLMTGRYNNRNYKGFEYLDPKEKTFANDLRKAGYATAMVGKWQLNGIGRMPNWQDRNRPKSFGFDAYLLWQLTLPRERAERYAGAIFETADGPVDLGPDGYGPDKLLETAKSFIDQHDKKPFVLYYSMVLTHCPFWPTPESKEWADPKRRRPGDKYKGDPKFFRDQVAYADRMVGSLVKHLADRGLRDNTLIMVTGDNGTDQPIESKMQDGSVIAGGKGLTTDAGTRVPLIVSWPGTVPKGEVSQDLVDFTDVLPTLLDAAGLPTPTDRHIDGRSLLPRLRKDPGATAREWVFCHYWGDNGRKPEGTVEFIRDQRYKLYGSGELYDIPADPLEKRPLKDREEVRVRLQAALDKVRIPK